jgi:hypothetical protein
MKILILVLSEKREGYYVAMERAIRKTWGPKCLENDSIVDVLYTYGQWDREIKGDVMHNEDQLHINYPEGYFTTSGKHIKTLEYVYNNYEFDYVFRTNLSAYIHPENLVKHAETLPNENVYHGLILDHHPDKKEAKIISGAGFFLSRDVVKLMIDNKDQIVFKKTDDVAQADFLHGKVEPSVGRRRDYLMRWKNWKGVDDDTHYHYRVHTTIGEPVHERRKDDVLKINAIHEHFFPNV